MDWFVIAGLAIGSMVYLWLRLEWFTLTIKSFLARFIEPEVVVRKVIVHRKTADDALGGELIDGVPYRDVTDEVITRD